MKRCLILLLILPLVGCYSGQQQQLARCVYDAENYYPSATWLVGDEKQIYVWLCMSAHGYRLNREQNACAGKDTPAPETMLYAQCYEPRAKFAALIYRLEKAFGR